MNDVYKLMIEKGGLFGIVCVVVIVIISGVLTVITKKNYTEQPINSIIKFVKYFFIISVGFILVVTLLNKCSSDQPTFTKAIPRNKIKVIRTKNDSIPLTGISFLRINQKNIALVRYTYILGSGYGQDTIANMPIDQVTSIRLYTFNNYIIITNQIGDSEGLQYDKINGARINAEIQSLIDEGYPLTLEYKYMSTEPVIGIIMFIIGILCLLGGNDFDGGCFIQLFGLSFALIGLGMILAPM